MLEKLEHSAEQFRIKVQNFRAFNVHSPLELVH